MLTHEEIYQSLQEKFGDSAVLSIDMASSPSCIQIEPQSIVEICKWLRDQESFYFDQLSCITAVDLGEKEASINVVYHLYSIPYNCSLALNVQLSREKPSVDSISEIWAAANWHEREAYDLMGVAFSGHPDLRRILLPADWVGHPLRKDYEAVGKYHGLPLKYKDARQEE